MYEKDDFSVSDTGGSEAGEKSESVLPLGRSRPLSYSRLMGAMEI